MRTSAALIAAVALTTAATAAGCAIRGRSHPAFPPVASTPVAILPVGNLTGDPLVIHGEALLDRALGRARLTVPDLLAAAAVGTLRERGWSLVDTPATGSTPRDAVAAAGVAASGEGGRLLLYLEVRRWEPDAATHPAFVIVGVSARLFEGGTGREVWSANPPIHPVATPGSIILESAYTTAADAVVAELLGSPRAAR